MNVFVLLQRERHEGGELYGVYASRELAEQARDQAKQPDLPDLNYWEIEEVELNAPARFHSWVLAA